MVFFGAFFVPVLLVAIGTCPKVEGESFCQAGCDRAHPSELPVCCEVEKRCCDHFWQACQDCPAQLALDPLFPEYCCVSYRACCELIPKPQKVVEQVQTREERLPSPNIQRNENTRRFTNNRRVSRRRSSTDQNLNVERLVGSSRRPRSQTVEEVSEPKNEVLPRVSRRTRTRGRARLSSRSPKVTFEKIVNEPSLKTGKSLTHTPQKQDSKRAKVVNKKHRSRNPGKLELLKEDVQDPIDIKKEKPKMRESLVKTPIRKKIVRKQSFKRVKPIEEEVATEVVSKNPVITDSFVDRKKDITKSRMSKQRKLARKKILTAPDSEPVASRIVASENVRSRSSLGIPVDTLANRQISVLPSQLSPIKPKPQVRRGGSRRRSKATSNEPTIGKEDDTPIPNVSPAPRVSKSRGIRRRSKVQSTAPKTLPNVQVISNKNRQARKRTKIHESKPVKAQGKSLSIGVPLPTFISPAIPSQLQNIDHPQRATAKRVEQPPEIIQIKNPIPPVPPPAVFVSRPAPVSKVQPDIMPVTIRPKTKLTAQQIIDSLKNRKLGDPTSGIKKVPQPVKAEPKILTLEAPLNLAIPVAPQVSPSENPLTSRRTSPRRRIPVSRRRKIATVTKAEEPQAPQSDAPSHRLDPAVPKPRRTSLYSRQRRIKIPANLETIPPKRIRISNQAPPQSQATPQRRRRPTVTNVEAVLGTQEIAPIEEPKKVHRRRGQRRRVQRRRNRN